MARFAVVIEEPVYTASDRSFVKRDYDTKEPIVDEAGLNTFQTKVMTASGGRVETFDVDVKGKEDPISGIAPMTPVKLVDPEISFGLYKGKKYHTLSAKGIEHVGARKA